MVQKTISNQAFATGMFGDFARAGSQDSAGYFLNSTIGTLNVPARIVHFLNNNNNEVGVNAAGPIAGMIGSAKDVYREGLEGGSHIKNQEQAEIVVSGYMFVDLPAAANQGDWVYYTKADGKLNTAPPNTIPSVPNSLRLAGSRVTGENVQSAGIAEIFFDLSGSDVTPTA